MVRGWRVHRYALEGCGRQEDVHDYADDVEGGKVADRHSEVFAHGTMVCDQSCMGAADETIQHMQYRCNVRIRQ